MGPPFAWKEYVRGLVRRPRRAARGRRRRRARCASVHREKFKPLGGPDGGNGGHGGDVVLVVDPGVHTLLDFHFRPHAAPATASRARASYKAGANGEALELRVPDGTVVLAADGAVLADLVGAGTRFIAARGGRGGLGNAALASRRKAPGFALLGEPGETRDLVLELKIDRRRRPGRLPQRRQVLAGRGAVRGPAEDRRLPVHHAASRTWAWSPRAARGLHGRRRAGADPGRGQGKGLGLEFLRHIERCSVLVHVIDCATVRARPRPGLGHRGARGRARPVRRRRWPTGPRLVALNKIDVPDARELAELVRPDLAERRLAGVRDLRGHPRGPARADVRAGRRGRALPARSLPPPSRPGSCCARARVDDGGFTVEPDPEDAGRVHRARRAARALDPADRLRQRRGRRLPGRPAGPARRRGRAGRGRRGRRVPRSRSATSPSTGSRRLAAGSRSCAAARGTDRRVEARSPDQRGRAAGRVPDPARGYRPDAAESLERGRRLRRRRSPGTAATGRGGPRRR